MAACAAGAAGFEVLVAEDGGRGEDLGLVGLFVPEHVGLVALEH